MILPVISLILLTLCVECAVVPYSKEHVRNMKQETKDLFVHGWSSYMKYGFPYDEVRPESCKPYGPDYDDIDDIIRNDAMGNTSSTVLDNIDTLIIMEQWDELSYILEYLKQHKNDIFNQNTIIQVFEHTIRHLGGLMSGHLLIEMLQKSQLYQNIPTIDQYDGFLLDLAHILGKKLLPAFKTKTRIPVPRINLAKGVRSVPRRLQEETCLSGATTPVLEFTLLSRLTGDFEFEKYSDATFWKLWSSRSDLGLLPMSIDPLKETWLDSVTGIGASTDSFYEYAAKSSILFGDSEMWHVFSESYRALLTHSRLSNLQIFANVDVHTGNIASDWIDSLGAFWSGLQVLTGQVTDAINTHLMYWKIWNTYDSIPERWVFHPTMAQNSINLEWYPLRPEFIESTYYLFRATRDPMYLRIGEKILHLLKTKFKSQCGFRGFQNIRTGEMQDRMETFVLSETLKYLYLLFDEENTNILHSQMMVGKNWIFSTEAHPLWYSKDNVVSEGEVTEFHNKIRQNSSTFYFRNTNKVNPHKYIINGQKNIVRKDPFMHKFYQCEVPEINQWPFIGSRFYRTENLFETDYQFRHQLQRPKHLGEPAAFELKQEFFERYSLGSKSQCELGTTTSTVNLLIGDITQLQKTEIVFFANQGPGLTPKNDIWIPQLTNCRIILESKTIGNVDEKKQIISREYIDSQIGGGKNSFMLVNGKTVPVSASKKNKEINEILRIKSINGIEVGDSKVWISPYLCGDLCVFESPDKVLVQGYYVENLYAWW